MFKNKLIPLLSFAICVILGLLLSNLLVIYILYSRTGSIDLVISDTKSLINILSSYELLITQMCSQVFSLILPAWIYWRMSSDSNLISTRNPFRYDMLFLSLVFFISALPLVNLSAYLNQLLPLSDWMNATESQMNDLIEKMIDFHSISDLIIGVIVIAVIPAIGEEWVFRGIIQNLLVRWTKNKWIGLILASVFFSAIHLQFQGFLPRFVLGFVLGFVYLNSGNLWHSIILHFINNGFQVIGAYLYKDEILKQMKSESELPNLFLVAIATLVVFSTGYIIYQRNKFNSNA